ncbi:hypothetical protein DMN91_008008 [Ooceraea biroi]|uniref:Uncharacterized protein n=1 Tax=Ooceraea biroi TaxID=2015173 RepID=A0A026VVC1_OOCBI|nr:uncharacterized protein LOC105286372 [Ooceraea biroi]XP_026827516.1 uncharacterized protein LOC113562361 [Ooceraea biroi]EZA47595.1 hypothetical protein X777_15646 [Ooceraea biroi]RLU19450.1 hypothetical protein DMN91_008007 [Ooceraea biroi]RLU19451.1 hypothetical protein DMN91_008008 [Ooceraea biroi]
MRTINKNLRNEIKLKIMNKFGQRISLNKLYETILRQIVYNVKTNLNKTTIYFTKRMKDVKESYTEGLSTFSKLIQEHTQKLSFVTLLIEEESKLQKLKQHVPANKSQLEENYKSDIRKLKKIFENQMQQKYLYQNNMKNLTLKIKS